MKKLLIIGIFVIALLTNAASCLGQILPEDVCRVENNRLIFKINTGWNERQNTEFLKTFDFDSTWLAYATKGNKSFTIGEVIWKVNQLTLTTIEVSKDLSEKRTNNKNPVFSKLFRFDDLFRNIAEIISPPSITYGTNQLINPELIRQGDSLITIGLNGFKGANSVFLSGSFNEWAISESPLDQTETGWELKIKLQPGKYTYKFIIDGNWITDPNNELKENDISANTNSILYVYNYQFILEGYQNASVVIVTGTFNNWEESGYKMTKNNGKWIFPIYLSPGKYTYKFIVDKQWILDPGNDLWEENEYGTDNSVLWIN